MKDRNIACIDYDSGRIDWIQYIAGIFFSWLIYDINEDRKNEIIISTRSPANGININGMSDSNAYILCYNLKGQLLWKIVEPKIFININVFMNNSDELFGLVSDSFFRSYGKLFKINPQNGKIIKSVKINSGCNYGYAVADLNNDNKDEIIEAINLSIEAYIDMKNIYHKILERL